MGQWISASISMCCFIALGWQSVCLALLVCKREDSSYQDGKEPHHPSRAKHDYVSAVVAASALPCPPLQAWS
jgi:hypothetical protein